MVSSTTILTGTENENRNSVKIRLLETDSLVEEDIKNLNENPANYDLLITDDLAKKDTLNENENDMLKTDSIKNDKEIKMYKSFLGEFQTELVWHMIIVMTILHILAIYALVKYNPFKEKVTIFAFIYSFIAGHGATVGVHRYWAHRTFKATLPYKLILMACFSAVGHNSIFYWVRDHRIHHKFTDTDADPHNIKRGFFFAHIGWLFMKRRPEVLAKGRLLDLSDIKADPVAMFHKRNWIWLNLLFAYVIPTMIPVYLYGESWEVSFLACVVRHVIVSHLIFNVNSFAHYWGNKPYNQDIKSVENGLVSYLSGGEGWHNYHHTFPFDYKAAEFGNNFFLDYNTYSMHAFRALGMAYDFKSASPELIAQVSKRLGDGSRKKTD